MVHSKSKWAVKVTLKREDSREKAQWAWRRQGLTCPAKERILLGGDAETGCCKGRVLEGTQSVPVAVARLAGSWTGKPVWVWIVETWKAKRTGGHSAGKGEP